MKKRVFSSQRRFSLGCWREAKIPLFTILTLLAIALYTSPVSAQLTPGDIERVREEIKANGGTYTAAENPATTGPQPPEFVPEPDLNAVKAISIKSIEPRDDLPEAFDWREHNGCTPIKNQRYQGRICGSCWAFACLGVTESQILINEGIEEDLSEQWLISCTDAGDCDFWHEWYGHAYDYLIPDGLLDACGDYGAVYEEDFPYRAETLPCGCPYEHPYWLDAYHFIVPYGQRPTVEQIKQAIYDYGPVSSNVVWDSHFASYSGGIFNHENNTGSLNHSINLVGWDDNQGTEGIWILRNAYGDAWGESGYMRIEYECHRVGYNAVWVEYSPRTGLWVTPRTAFISEGPQGGPFVPDSLIYTLENWGDTAFYYSVSHTQPWVSITNRNGRIEPNSSVDVLVHINELANLLANGRHADILYFTNVTNHVGDTEREVRLNVGMETIYSWTLDSDPGWDTEELWAFGVPAGRGGDEHGYPDPDSGFTGDNVYGYNLQGDYTDNMDEEHLTTGPIDCSNLTDVDVRFRRWLNVEQPQYDHAYFRISTDGSTWTTIWENPVEMTDSGWVKMTFHVSEIADGQPEVYLRWTMGITDDGWTYSGWNIDDIEILGIEQEDPPLIFNYPDSLPEYIRPCGGTTFRVEVQPGTVVPRPGTAWLHYSTGHDYSHIPVRQVSSNVYDAMFPAFECLDQVEFYMSAETMEGGFVTDPLGAPNENYMALSATDFAIAFEDDFSGNSGWTGLGGNGEWTIAEATGGTGGDQYGGPDPELDHSPTSDNGVLGNDLTPGNGGDYEANLNSTYWVTSPVIDCSDYRGVVLSFYRWLGVERNLYDHAYLQAFDGDSWETVFENGETTIDESEWTRFDYNLSEIADGNADFQIRFGIGETDHGWQYCGWNIDDLTVKGYYCEVNPVPAVSIDMEPENPPIIVPAGSSFHYTGTIENNTSETRLVDVWLVVGFPGGNTYRLNDSYQNVPLLPGQRISISHITQSVPRIVPVGDYTYTALCGYDDFVVLDSTRFQFTVIGSMGKGADDWYLSDWFDPGEPNLPRTTELRSSYPNPFNSSTNLEFALSKAGRVKMEVFNIMGRRVSVLLDKYLEAGIHSVQWDAHDFASGIYFCRLTAAGESFTKRMVLIK